MSRLDQDRHRGGYDFKAGKHHGLLHMAGKWMFDTSEIRLHDPAVSASPGPRERQAVRQDNVRSGLFQAQYRQ
jgi:hypothetical protein